MNTVAVRRSLPGNDPVHRVTGWAVVAGLHVLLGWSLISGTALRGPDVVNKPMEAALIQEVILPTLPPPPPPPPPPVKKIEPPKAQPRVKAPPPPFVPPPEVTPPQAAAPAIQSVQAPPPNLPALEAPPPAPQTPLVTPSAPSRSEMAVVCPTQAKPAMPSQAAREGTEGSVRAQALIREGAVREVTILSGPRVFHSAVRSAMLRYKCLSEASDVVATQEFFFKLE